MRVSGLSSAPLHVGLVARSVNLHHVRGTGRYVQELLRPSAADDSLRWTALGHDPGQPLQLPPGTRAHREVFAFRGDRLELWEQLGLPLRLKRLGVQVLHAADNTAPWWQPVPTVVTIHDTVPWAETTRDGLQHRYLHHLQPRAFARCAAVITISEHSRRDILARWPHLAPRLVVIPHGIAPDFFEPASNPRPSSVVPGVGDSPYLMYVGGGQPKKRFGWALQLLQTCGRPDLHLVACGFSAEAARAAAVPGDLAGRVHFAPFIQDAELVALYRGAQATLYPTLYEGFGFPAVESQAAGTPVIFSPVSSLAELVGPLAWTPDLHDEVAWRQALADTLALGPEARAQRAAQARRWAARFSWSESLRRHREVYQAAAEGFGRAA